MNVLTGVGILFLSMLIMAFLQLRPGVFLLLSHRASGKFSHKKASDLTLSFLLGCEIVVAAIFVSLHFIVDAILGLATASDLNLKFFAYIFMGILAAICIVFPFCYYRKGDGTQLFIPRHLAESFQQQVKATKTRSAAFILGITSAIPELIFTLPLYLLSSYFIILLGETALVRASIIFLFIIATLMPLLIIHILMQHDHNLANLEKSRIQHKTFFKFLISFCYLLIIVLLIFRVLS